MQSWYHSSGLGIVEPVPLAGGTLCPTVISGCALRSLGLHSATDALILRRKSFENLSVIASIACNVVVSVLVLVVAAAMVVGVIIFGG